MGGQSTSRSGAKLALIGGAVSSPRTYFGRASRAVGAAPRARSASPAAKAPSARPHSPIYRAGDPALPLFAGLALPFEPTAPLIGAVATLSGAADGEHERLMLDLGTSQVRAMPRRDAGAATYRLNLSRTQGAEIYRRLLASLRYVNDAPRPTDGIRRVVLHVFDAQARSRAVAEAIFTVGEPAPQRATSASPRAAFRQPARETRVAPQRPQAKPAPRLQIIDGERVRFNTDGAYTLFWWPQLLAAARAQPPARRKASSHAPSQAAVLPASYFTGGGKLYRVFDAPPPPPPAPANVPGPANVSGKAGAAAAIEPKRAAAGQPRPANDAWTRKAETPPAEAPRKLRPENIFSPEPQDSRRIIDQRLSESA